MRTLQKEVEGDISGVMQRGKMLPSNFRGAKKDEDGNVVKPREHT